MAATTEPVAAAMAVLHAETSPMERGLVHGGGRIARLVHRVLVVHGYTRVDLGDPQGGGEYDFAVETGGGSAAIRALVDAVRFAGRIVLRSRPAEPLGLDMLQILPREDHPPRRPLRLLPMAAANLLASGKLGAGESLGAARPLEDFAEVLAEARRSEREKLFFSIDPELG